MPKIKISIPDDYLCPITHELMSNPVVTADGQVYERSAIEEWLKDRDTSPKTNLKLKNKELTAVPFIKNQIQSFFETNKLCTSKQFLDAIHEAIELKTLAFIQKLNYLDSYLEVQDRYQGRSFPLHFAADNGYFDMVVWLLAEGANVKSKNEFGNTPLHVARSADIAELLLAKGADLEAKNNFGSTPLHMAAANDRAEVVKLLLRKGANIQAKNNEDQTPEECHEIVVSISLYAAKKNYNEIKFLLLSRDSNFTDQSELHLAIQYQQINEVKYLLKNIDESSIDLEAKDKYGWTPLFLAIRNGLIEVVRWLLEEKGSLIDTKASVYHGLNDYTPLHFAAYKGHKEIVQLLLDYGANMYALDGNKCTPIQVAKEKGHMQIVRLFQIHEAPQKLVELEQINRQQNQMLKKMQEQIKSLTLQLKQLKNQQKSDPEVKKPYSSGFHFSKT